VLAVFVGGAPTPSAPLLPAGALAPGGGGNGTGAPGAPGAPGTATAIASANNDRDIQEGSPPAPPSKSKSGLPLAAIVGGGVGVVVLLAAVLLVIFRNKLCGGGQSHDRGQAFVAGSPMPDTNHVARAPASVKKPIGSCFSCDTSTGICVCMCNKCGNRYDLCERKCDAAAVCTSYFLSCSWAPMRPPSHPRTHSEVLLTCLHCVQASTGTYPDFQPTCPAPSMQHGAYGLSPAPYAAIPTLFRPPPLPSFPSYTKNAFPPGSKFSADYTSSTKHAASLSVRSTTSASPALTAFTSTAARDEGRFSSTALEATLDAMCDKGHAFLGVYEVLGPMQRVAGGQGLVQFMRRVNGSEEFAVKFYTYLPAFERERALYEDGALRPMMPATHEIVANGDGGILYGTYTFPPCIVLERGESLETWALREDRDFITTLQVLHHIAQRLLSMHKAGWAHLDLKPGNVLRRPTKHSWTLIDFGCSAEIGAHSASHRCVSADQHN
jgi:hypothetical protein